MADLTPEELEAQRQAEAAAAAAAAGAPAAEAPADAAPDPDPVEPENFTDPVDPDQVDVAASERETQRQQAAEALEAAAVKRGGLKRAVLHNRQTWPAGTDPAELDLTDEQRERLKRIGAL